MHKLFVSITEQQHKQVALGAETLCMQAWRLADEIWAQHRHVMASDQSAVSHVKNLQSCYHDMLMVIVTGGSSLADFLGGSFHSGPVRHGM